MFFYTFAYYMESIFTLVKYEYCTTVLYFYYHKSLQEERTKV
jgi:hypothetical protein